MEFGVPSGGWGAGLRYGSHGFDNRPAPLPRPSRKKLFTEMLEFSTQYSENYLTGRFQPKKRMKYKKNLKKYKIILELI
jgi:hypothetical protein